MQERSMWVSLPDTVERSFDAVPEESIMASIRITFSGKNITPRYRFRFVTG